MNCLPLFSSELSPKRVGKWLSVASPSVPNLMEQIVAQRASPAHCLLPPAVGRGEGIGGGGLFALCGKRNNIPPPVFLPFCLIKPTRRMLPLPKCLPPPPRLSLSRLSGEPLCLFTLPGPRVSSLTVE